MDGTEIVTAVCAKCGRVFDQATGEVKFNLEMPPKDRDMGCWCRECREERDQWPRG